MKTLAISAALALLASGSAPAWSSAAAPPTVRALGATSATATARLYGIPCRDRSNNVVLRVKPRKCILGGRFGYQQANIRRIKWRSWGGRSAYGRGILRDNMRFRARVRFKVYRLDHWEENFYIYRRARGTTYPRGRAPLHWRIRLPLS
jgi:hypothetical protein